MNYLYCGPLVVGEIRYVGCSLIPSNSCPGIRSSTRSIPSMSYHISLKTGLLLRFNCRTFLTEIAESKALEDDEFLTLVSSHLYSVGLC